MVGNLGRLTDGLWRGAQPTPEGFAWLAARGVARVINLREEDDSERFLVERLGMRYHYLPLGTMTAPTHEDAVAFLRIVDEPAGRAFFHCLYGADRTGTMAAVYRLSRMGWELPATLAELHEHGFHADQLAKLAFICAFPGYLASPGADRVQASPEA